jgi:hypothetical protein
VLSVEDRTAINDLIALHGHLADRAGLDRMDEVFTQDATFDLADFGYGVVEGLATLRELAKAISTHPVGHHVTNIVLTPHDDQRVHAQSKGIAVNADGTTASVTYEDTISRQAAGGWRITQRRVIASGGSSR